jgi:O-acetyl-ADP-ribose deacetylase (regulator of RNase III)
VDRVVTQASENLNTKRNSGQGHAVELQRDFESPISLRQPTTSGNGVKLIGRYTGPMKVTKGDLIKLALDRRFDVIVHGCNCQCVMGAGIAKTIKQTFPEAYKADLATKKGSREKLGSISTATTTRGGHQVTVVNGYTQFHWRGSGVLVDYDAVRTVMREVKARFVGRRIGYPKIGAGLAKGDWRLIAQIIDAELAGEDHTLVEYAP